MLASLRFVERFLKLPKKSVKIKCPAGEYERLVPDVELLAPLLTRQGFEVEAVIYRGKDCDGVVVGKIVSAEPHPKAERLQVCQVDVGTAKKQQIVCGAKNARSGLFVAVAMPGTSLKNGTLLIQPTLLREVESNGMLCSREELGLELNAQIDGDGIWELNIDAQGGINDAELSKNLGRPVFDVLGLSDTLFELNVTPNRPDILCHYGVAREIAVGLVYAEKPVDLQKMQFNSGKNIVEIEKLAADVVVNSSSTVGGVQFSADNELGVSAFFVALENIVPRPSPAWLRNQLEALGQNSINTIVDASNFILWAYGQPSHAFDVNKLKILETGNAKLSLRLAHENESFTGLDRKTRTLHKHDCVVADAENPQALLGLIGGEYSKVDSQTKAIVIEFANANAVAVRRSSRRHGRRTDSSFLFEKGISTDTRFEAAVSMIELIKNLSEKAPKYCGALHSKLLSRPGQAQAFVSDLQLKSLLGPASEARISVDFAGIIIANDAEEINKISSEFSKTHWQDWRTDTLKKRTVEFLESDVKSVLGVNLVEFNAQLNILRSLGFGVECNSKVTKASVRIPSWRVQDIVGMPDLVEEIVRVVGIDHVPSVPLNSMGELKSDDSHLSVLELISTRAASLGYNEIAGFHFMKTTDLNNMGMKHISALGEPLAMLNSISKDEPLMHTSLIPNLLRCVERNLNFGNSVGQLFHVTRTYQNHDSGGNIVFKDNGEAIEMSSEFNKMRELLKSNAHFHDYSPELSYGYSFEKNQNGRPAETPRLAGVVFGDKELKSWQNSNATVWNLHDVLAHVNELIRSAGLEAQIVEMMPSHPFNNTVHPGRKAQFVAIMEGMEPVPLGWAAQLHPKVLRAFGIETICFAFELNLSSVMKACAAQAKNFKSRIVSSLRFPVLSRDFAFVIEEKISASKLTEVVQNLLHNELLCGEEELAGRVPARLVGVRIFDVYRGKGVPEGSKSIAFNIKLEPLLRTLTDVDIQKIHSSVISGVTSALGGEMRG